MQRILQGVSATLSRTITVDGAATDPTPDSATVTITRADGTELVTDVAATNDGVGVFTYTLTPAQTAVLGVLDLEWQITIGGYEQTLTDAVEIVGGLYFTVGEFYARYPDVEVLSATYTPAKVAEARELAVSTLEDATGISWVRRAGYASVYGYNGLLRLPGYPVRSVSAVTDSNGSAVDMTYADIDGDSVRLRCWPARALTVAFEYGHDRPPSRVKQAVMILTKAWLVTGPVDTRATQMSSSDGGTINLATPGVFGSITGLPEVDATINAYRLVSV